MNGNDVIESEKVQEADEESSESFLRPLIEKNAAKALQSAVPFDHAGVVVGELIGLTDNGQTLLVNFPGNPTEIPVPAFSTTQFNADDVGREVALLFEKGDPNKPLIIGKIQQTATMAPKNPIKKETVIVDGETVFISAEKEIVLQCGKSSITLTRAGKILIKGEYLSSRSTGVNRIKGGSIQLN